MNDMVAVGQTRWQSYATGGRADVVGCTSGFWWLLLPYGAVVAFTTEEVLMYWPVNA